MNSAQRLNGLHRFQQVAAIGFLLCACTANTQSAGDPLLASSILEPRDIATIRDIANLAISPQGDRLVFLLNEPDPDGNRHRLTWMTAVIDGSGDATAIADGGVPIPISYLHGHPGEAWWWDVSVKWSPDGKHIAFTKGVDKVRQLWIARAEGGGERLLSNRDRNVLAFAWTADGEGVLYQEGESTTAIAQGQREKRARGFVFDDQFSIVTRESVAPAERFTFISDADFARQFGDRYPVRKRLLTQGQSVSASEVETEHYLSALGVSDDDFAARAAQTDVAFTDLSVSSLRLSDDGESAIWTEKLDSELAHGPLRLVAWPRALKSEPVVCKVSDACVGYWSFSFDAWITPNGEKVLFRRSEEGISRTPETYVWNLIDNRIHKLADVTDSLRNCVVANTEAYCVHSAAVTPPQLVALALDDGAVRTLYTPNKAIERFRLPRVETFNWEIENRKRGFGRLVYPLDHEPDRRYPLVVSCYSTGRFLRGGVGEHTPLLVMASRGYFVLECALPHHYDLEYLNSAKDPSEFSRRLGLNVERYRWWARGIKAAVDELERRGLVDPDSVAMAGHSNGAYATAQALIDGDWLAAAVMLTPTGSEQLVFSINQPGNQDSFTAAGVGPGTGAWDYQNFAVHANHVDAPLLVQASESEMLPAISDYSHLRRAGVPVELIIFGGEFHSKTQPAHKLSVYERTADWFDFWLREVEDPDPAKADQYERWRKLREVREKNLSGNAKSR